MQIATAAIAEPAELGRVPYIQNANIHSFFSTSDSKLLDVVSTCRRVVDQTWLSRIS